MPKVSELIRTLQNQYKPDDVIAYDIWSVKDVDQEIYDRNHCADDDFIPIKMTQADKETVIEWLHNENDGGLSRELFNLQFDEVLEKQEELESEE
jgi:hypothetical protein